jgi:hypothetical protein
MVNRLTPEERLERSRELGIIVDEEDEWLLSAFTWRFKDGYVTTNLWHQSYMLTAFLHHYIVGQPIHDRVDIDHVDRNTLNNRRSNLEYKSHARNNQNSTPVEEASNISVTPYGRYQVLIQRDGTRYHVGVYATEAEARDARTHWLEEYSKLQDGN